MFKHYSAALAALLGISAHAAPTYSILDLGALNGGFTSGLAVNNAGLVAGVAVPGFNQERAFLYAGGPLEDLGTLGGNVSFGTGINNRGEVVGASNATNNGSSTAFLYSGGSMVSLGVLGSGPYSRADAINDAGQVVGYSEFDDTGRQHAFLYSDGSMKDLGTFGGAHSNAFGINSQGWVTGFASTPGNLYRAFLYANGSMSDLGTLGGRNSLGYGINDLGVVVGSSEFGWFSEGFVYEHGVMSAFGTLGGFNSLARAINNRGQIVGSADLANGRSRPVLAYGGGMADFNTLLDPSDAAIWDVRGTYAINDHGQVTGMGVIDGETHAFLATCRSDCLGPLPAAFIPVLPEPQTYSLMVAGLLGLMLRRVHGQRRRHECRQTRLSDGA